MVFALVKMITTFPVVKFRDFADDIQTEATACTIGRQPGETFEKQLFFQCCFTRIAHG